MSVFDSLTAVADRIRLRTGRTALLTLAEMPEAIDSVYDAGKQNEYDRLWDAVQQKGERRNYTKAFFGAGWNDESFRPKYDIIIDKYGDPMNYVFASSEITDLAKLLDDADIVIDTSAYVGEANMSWFSDCGKLTRVPLIEFPDKIKYAYHFYKCYALETIEGFTMSSTNTVTVNTFYHCNALKNITVTGEIHCDFTIYHSPLTKESIISVYSALSDESTGKTVTFNRKAVNSAFETSEGAADGSTSDEWLELVASKPNWTFSLM